MHSHIMMEGGPMKREEAEELLEKFEHQITLEADGSLSDMGRQNLYCTRQEILAALTQEPAPETATFPRLPMAPQDRLPAGYWPIPTYGVLTNGSKIVVLGEPDDTHDCDAMGCGTFDHVVAIAVLPERRKN